jgi:hypothetical protein
LLVAGGWWLGGGLWFGSKNRFSGLLVRWGPALCAVDDVDNFDCVRLLQHAIDDDEGQRRQGKFTRPFHPAAPPQVRIGAERSGAIVNRLSNALRGAWVIRADVIEDLLEVLS